MGYIVIGEYEHVVKPFEGGLPWGMVKKGWGEDVRCTRSQGGGEVRIKSSLMHHAKHSRLCHVTHSMPTKRSFFANKGRPPFQ